jgi:outer membrane protein, multidrug efflux system
VSRGLLAAALVAFSTVACAVGPSYREPAIAPEGAAVGLSPRPDSIRSFYDSLAAADTAAAGAAAGPRTLEPDSADLAWLAVLKDTTLLRLVNIAVRENRDVQTAVARIREFRAQVGVARSGLFPELSADGSVSTNQSAFGAFEPARFDAFRVTADVQWELDFWGRIRRGLQASRADLEVEEALHRATLLTLVSDVSNAYLELLELGQEQAIAERTLASRRATLALARSRFESGVISELDVHQFESEVAVPAASLAQVQRLRSQREHELAALVGRMPFTIPATADLARAVDAVRVPDSLPAVLLARRPDVRSAERAFAAAVARVGVAQASRLPRVSITGSYGSQSTTADDLFAGDSEVYQLQAGVSVPLFTGGRLANEARASGPAPVRGDGAAGLSGGERRARRRPHRAGPARGPTEPGGRAPEGRRAGEHPLSGRRGELPGGARRGAAALLGGVGPEPDPAARAQLGGGPVSGPGWELGGHTPLTGGRHRATRSTIRYMNSTPKRRFSTVTRSSLPWTVRASSSDRRNGLTP